MAGAPHRRSSAPIQRSTPPTSSPCSSAAGRLRSPSPKPVPILASRPNGNGPTKLSPAPRRHCLVFTALSLCGRAICCPRRAFLMPQPGIVRPTSPSPMPSARYGSPYGSETFINTPRHTGKDTKSLPTVSCVWQRLSASPHNVQSRA